MFEKIDISENDNFDMYDEPRLHMEQLLSTSIIELDLPMRIAYPLDDAGIRTIGDILRLSHHELLNVNRLGVKAVDEIEKRLERLDLFLKK